LVQAVGAMWVFLGLMQIWFAALANFCKGLLIAGELLVSFLCIVLMMVSGLLRLQGEVPESVFARMMALSTARFVCCGDGVMESEAVMLVLGSSGGVYGGQSNDIIVGVIVLFVVSIVMVARLMQWEGEMVDGSISAQMLTLSVALWW